MKIGTTDIKEIFLGTTEVKKIFSGTTLLYEKISTPSIPPRYVQVLSSNFSGSGNYTGTEEYIILPKNKPFGYKIVNINVKGVATNGDYLTHANSMFYGNNSLYLELDYLNTSNVISMVYMFRNSQATELDLSSFDTSNVTDMYGMFWDSQATILDLSSFDTSNVTDMGFMFSGSQATIGYARTQTDADKFNSSSNKPSTLTFVVK